MGYARSRDFDGVPPPGTLSVQRNRMILDLSSLKNALAALERGLARYQSAPADEELRDACIQRFEFTFELSWRMLKRRLEMDLPDAQGVDAMSYRALIRAGAELGLIDDVPGWFVYREKRNITSHAYDAAKAAEVAAVLPEFALHARRLLERLAERGRTDA
jgi:nucleotidyltransferase substrate binding protein (TIGR01987 family)